jgi:hypothetical protein
MELVKKNILSIICGVVALAAIAFHFVYTSGQFTALEARAQARAGKAKAIDDLLKQERAFPAVGDAAPPKLERFPNPRTIEVAEGIAAKLHNEATRLTAKAVEINRTGYDLLVPGSFPRPDFNQVFQFRAAYNAVLAPGGQPTAPGLVNLPDGILKAAKPPTEQEIAEAKLQLWKDQYAPRLVLVNNAVVNQREIVSEFLRATLRFDEEFRRKRAENFKVYLEPGALGLNPTLIPQAPQAPTAENMWYGQMSYWVQRDVCVAVAKMNAQAANIPAAPVKHLVAVDVKQDATMYRRPGGVTGAPAAAAPAGEMGVPPPVDPAAAAGPTAKDYVVSPTGRVSNSVYDVVHFDVVVVVDAEMVQQFLRMLQHGRFINVYHMEIQNVDLAEAEDAGYSYGRRPVVELTVRCEALFLRDWTVRNKGPMPVEVQRVLGIPPEAPAAPGAPAEPGAVAAQQN